MAQITDSGVIIKENVEIALPRESVNAIRRLVELGKQGKIGGISRDIKPCRLTQQP